MLQVTGDTLSTEGAVFEMVIESEFAARGRAIIHSDGAGEGVALLVEVDKVLEEPTVVPLRSQL